MGGGGTGSLVLAALGLLLGAGGFTALLRVRAQNLGDRTSAEEQRIAAQIGRAESERAYYAETLAKLRAELEEERADHETTRTQLYQATHRRPPRRPAP